MWFPAIVTWFSAFMMWFPDVSNVGELKELNRNLGTCIALAVSKLFILNPKRELVWQKLAQNLELFTTAKPEHLCAYTILRR